DPRDDARGADRYLGAHAQDDLLRHARYRRGGLSGRPRRRAQRAPGPDPRGGRDRAAAPALRLGASVYRISANPKPYLGPARRAEAISTLLTMLGLTTLVTMLVAMPLPFLA